MKSLLLYLVIFVIAVGCRDHKETYDIDRSFWPPVEEEADSLVAILNSKAVHAIYEPGDTVLANRIDSIGRVKQLPQLRARALFWNIMTRSRYGLDSALVADLERAISLCDSVAYPYDHARMIIERPSVPVLTPERAMSYQKAVELFKECGDSAYYASTKALMVHYVDRYSHEKALEMGWSVSRTLHNINANVFALSVDYNIAVMLYDTFQYERAFAMLDSLRQNPELHKYNRLVLMVDIMQYEKDNDAGYLYDALQRCDSLRRPAAMQGCVVSTLAAHYIDKGMPDSVLYFKNRLNEENINKPLTKHIVYANLIKVYESEGKPDSAALFRPYIEKCEKERSDFKLGSQIESDIVSSTLSDMEQNLARLESEKNKTVSVVLSVSAILLCISGLTIWILVKRKRRQRSRLVAEQRRAAISEVRAAEKERALAEIVESVRSESDEFKPLIARIKANLTPDSDWQKVKLLFDEINPEFVDRLRRSYPVLTPSEVRLACLVYLGLDTKHIARLLSIAPDSVKKTRQRLRAKLAISPDTDLHDFLSGIMR
ncbi:MAG: hypothetical protein K2L55_08210 [Muribaculaceae bacterium]|nr:hypothetical protein [Muribaculaceae bacterium]